MDLLAVIGGGGPGAPGLLFQGTEAAGLQINFFWIIVSAVNFVVFLGLVYVIGLKPISKMLRDRSDRIEQGLRDAEQARKDRESAEAEHQAALAEARREANDILTRAQKIAQDTREADLRATREEIERLRQSATDEIDAEKQRAMADLRSQVAALALEAAGRVVGESMTDERQHRLVEEFLRESASGAGSKG
jgi:F-type H+-transporting ATPase subunit b